MAYLKIAKGFMELTGADATRFANGMLSCDVKHLEAKAPSVSRAYFLTPQGRIVSEVQLLVLAPNHICLAVLKEDFEYVFQELDKFIIADDVELKKSVLFSEDVLSFVASTRSSEFLSNRNENRNKFSLEQSYQLLERENCWHFTREIFSTDHFEIWPKAGVSTEELLTELGVDDKEWSESQFLDFRFQESIPLWRKEIRQEDSPIEFPVQDAFSFDKGCYRGQEAVNMGTFRGKAPRYLVFLEAAENIPASFQSAFVFDGENKVGQIRSLHKNKAFALLRRVTAVKEEGALILKNESDQQLEFSSWKTLVHEKSFRGKR